MTKLIQRNELIVPNVVAIQEQLQNSISVEFVLDFSVSRVYNGEVETIEGTVVFKGELSE